ncbi:MAG: hypothetical protein WDZ76_11390 [Pseudohongiellaceae bacterium]
MSLQVIERSSPAVATCVALAFALVSAIGSSSVLAQSNADNFRATDPELASLFDAFDVSQAVMFEKIAEINNAADTREARNEFEHALHMQKTMTMSEMMAMGHQMSMGDNGPYDDMEREARTQLIAMVRDEHSADDAMNAYDDSVLTSRAIAVIEHGRDFENQIYDIYADRSIADKGRAVDSAIAEYLRESGVAVPALPKPASAMFGHEYAGAFKEGFPRLRSLWWSTQWIQLATIEAMILEQQDPQYRNSIATVKERFWNKVGSDGGMSMFPTPVELPMAPAIAPQLYSAHPQASVIIDNLNMFETVIADILAYPNLQNRQAAINAAVDTFINQEENIDETYDYLLSALRGGIYNQGGPAVGELDRSERNRSRSAMNMQHSMVMPTP